MSIEKRHLAEYEECLVLIDEICIDRALVLDNRH